MLKVNNNFKQSHADLNCPLCSGEENNGIKFLDDQHHLLHCVKLVGATPAVPGEKCCSYRDIFSGNIDAMSAAADMLDRSLTKREEILKKWSLPLNEVHLLPSIIIGGRAAEVLFLLFNPIIPGVTCIQGYFCLENILILKTISELIDSLCSSWNHYSVALWPVMCCNMVSNKCHF